MTEKITITNFSRRTAVIDIEGVIGLDEGAQFEEPRGKVATYAKLKDTLEGLGGVKNARVVVNIRSAGGEVNDALLIHDALRASWAAVTTRCYGYVASAATIIAQAASPGRREISANALYLVHNSMSRAEGNAESIGRAMELLQQTDRRIAAIYAERSGRGERTFAELMNCNGGNGRWLSPRETLEMGLADRITGAKPLPAGLRNMVLDRGLPAPPEIPAEAPRVGLWERVMGAVGLADGGRRERGRRDGIVAGELPPYPAGTRVFAEGSPLAALHAGVPPAKLAARPTSTAPREDPPLGDARPSPNSDAYEQDALRMGGGK